MALPAFTTPWTAQHLGITPKPPPPATATVAPAPSDSRLLHWMIGALSLAVVSLGAYVVIKPPAPPLVVERTTVAAPSVAAAPASKKEADEPEPEPEPKAEAIAAPTDPEADAEAEAEAEAEAKTPRSRHWDKNPRPRRQPKVEPEPKKQDTMLPVECIIDPASCKQGKPPKKDPRESTSTKGLPAAPSSSQIRSAMAEVKPAAKACGPRHGASSGTKVRIKLSAKGATGAITSATAMDGHAGTTLGKCVAKALSKATLPRFSKKQVGIVYAVRL